MAWYSSRPTASLCTVPWPRSQTWCRILPRCRRSGRRGGWFPLGQCRGRPSSKTDQFWRLHTDKKENKIFLIYKEIQKGAVAKSYMRKGFLRYEELRKYLVPLVIYDIATAPFWISLYMKKIFILFFICALYHETTTKNLLNTSVHFYFFFFSH